VAGRTSPSRPGGRGDAPPGAAHRFCARRITHRQAGAATVSDAMGSLIKKRRKRMRKKKHKKMLKRTRFQRRAKGK
jgi:hypothetical protein